MRDSDLMRNLAMVGLVGLLAACTRPNPAPPTIVAPELRCPDATSCTIPNGTGVYFAEDGFAGLGPTDLMITHFINGPTVTFQARFRDPSTKLWRPLPGPGELVADYNGNASWQVASLIVDETTTVPIWTLQDPATKATTRVTGDALHELKLGLVFDSASHSRFVLDFNGPLSRSTEPPKNPESTYGLQWTDVTGRTAPAPYCHTPPAPAAIAPPSTAQWPADSVVFQPGIDVDPVTGAVTRDATTANHVTMSCYMGAPATVYRWGYRYLRGDTSYFDAGIHMKRASYCGDAAYYTVAGTMIHIMDNVPVTDDPPAAIEAWWTPTGASCVDLDSMRHPEIVARKGFTGWCGTRQLPTCVRPPRPPSTTRYLVDGPR